MKPLYKYYMYNVHAYINRYKVQDESYGVIHLLNTPQNPIVNLQLSTNMPHFDYMRGMKNFMLGLFFLFFIRKHWHK